MHLALLGDSTLDNAAYTNEGPAVIDHLSRLLSPPDSATLLAKDGAVTSNVNTQVNKLPQSATYVLLSVGGNDALQDIDLLDRSVASVKEGLLVLEEAVGRFEEAYRAALASVLGTGIPTSVCTIYTGDFSRVDVQQQVINAVLRIYNDVIIQAALDNDCPVVDLRRVCTERSDFTRQIEPTAQGGRKIANAIFRVHTDPNSHTTPVGPVDRSLSG